MSGESFLHPDIFDWQGIHIVQDEAVHKVGTDAVLLGTWVSTILSDPKYILDAGTGSGILAMMMSRSYPQAKIVAIDNDENAVRLARKNVSASTFEARVRVELEDIAGLSIQTDSFFDLIVSNPPFYTERILPAQESKRRAKHLCVPEAEWINSLLERVRPDGHLCIVVPFASAMTWINAANEKGYYNQHRLDVFSFAADSFPKRSLLHFSSRLQKPTIETLCIYTPENTYTQAYLGMTGIKATPK